EHGSLLKYGTTHKAGSASQGLSKTTCESYVAIPWLGLYTRPSTLSIFFPGLFYSLLDTQAGGVLSSASRFSNSWREDKMRKSCVVFLALFLAAVSVYAQADPPIRLIHTT